VKVTVEELSLLSRLVELLEKGEPVKINGRWFGTYTDGQFVSFPYKNDPSAPIVGIIDEPNTGHPLGTPDVIGFWVDVAKDAKKEGLLPDPVVVDLPEMLDKKEIMENAMVLEQLTAHESNLHHTWVDSVEYEKKGEKTVIALVTLYNGWEFIGKAHALDPKKFEMHIGKLYALKDVLGQLDGLAGFHQYIREKG
jgi:hypothetical protein